MVIPFCTSSMALECRPCGDANCDGTADTADALVIAQAAVGLRANVPCRAAGDVNADGSTDVLDALRIAQCAVGLKNGCSCPPVVLGLLPALVGSAGGETVRVTGNNFRPGTSVAVEGVLVATSQPDCESLDFQAARRHPGSVRVEAVDPDGQPIGSPLTLEIEGAFRDVTAAANLIFVPERGADALPVAGGIVVGDFDDDGEPDIFVPNHGGPNALFHSRGDGTFQNIASAAGVEDPQGIGTGACAADYDNDGDLDLYVTNLGPNRLFRSQGGRFFDVAGPLGVADPNRGTGCSWGDYDRDGFLDLYVANHLDESDLSVFITRKFDKARRPDRLFHNLGNGGFEDVTALLGDSSLVSGAGFGASFVDYDNDGDPDLYLVNDFGREIQRNVLWRNDGAAPGGWRFTDVSAVSGANIGIFGMGLAVGDYDANGFLDFYVTNIGGSALLRARGNGTFEDRGRLAGVARELIGQDYSVGWGDAFLDYDNDGWSDLYLVAGYLDSDPLVNDAQQPNALFRNRGDGTFEDVSEISGADDTGIGRGMAVADFDHDGFLDIVLVNLGQRLALLRNTGRGGGHWLELRLRGTRSNRDAIGARVTAQVGTRRLIREVVAGGSNMSQSAPEVHFGLGPSRIVDTIEVVWPSGTRQTIANVRADQRVTISEP